MGRHSKNWPKIRERNEDGKISYVVDAGKINGRRYRKQFPTRGEAETVARQLKVQREREGMSAFSLSEQHRVEAVRCNERLAPHGYTITDAVDYFINEVIAYLETPDISDAIKEFQCNQLKKNITPDWISDQNRTLNAFATAFGHMKINQLKKDDLEAFCYNPEGLAPKTYKHKIGNVSQFLRYCIRKEWIKSNLTNSIEKPESVQHNPGLLPVDEAFRLLVASFKLYMLGVVSIGLFAGVRNAELGRLQWPAVRRDERIIIIDASIAKTRARRVIEYDDTLASWLEFCPQTTGPVMPHGYIDKHLRKVRCAAGLKDWPHNALRHSFASYHLAKFQNAARTAHILGHVEGAELLHTNYRGLVTPTEANKYWALRPPESLIKKQEDRS